MRKLRPYLLVLMALALLPAPSVAQPPVQRVAEAKTLEVVGSIIRTGRWYSIRSKAPSELFRILNPNPAFLDGYLKSGKNVRIVVRSVVGDNVEIVEMDGIKYPPVEQPK